MPMHDWTRVRPNVYHHFHGRWIFALADALNTGGRPAEYYALAEQVTRPYGPDVLTLERPGGGNPGANGAAGRPPGGAGSLTVLAHPPRTRFAVAERPKPPRRASWRLSLRHNSDDRMVALIELVSPANKASRDKLRAFVGKAAGMLDAGIHLLVIDPFPPRKRDPNGMHGAIWKAVTGRPFTLPEGKLLTLASYSSGEEYTAYVEPVAVGDALPDMPLFLTPDEYVNVPLEAAYETTWRPFPDHWKAALTAG